MPEGPPDGLLLVYFSGHGVTLDGRDFLIPSERDALALWPVHQWLTTRQSMWRDSAARACYQDGARFLERDARGLAHGEILKLMETLLRAVGAHPTDSIVLDGLSAPYVDDRWRALASLLWIGGILAADPRRMPPVLADHVETRMDLPLSTVKDTTVVSVRPVDKCPWRACSAPKRNQRPPADRGTAGRSGGGSGI
ncbi:MAG TPA: hypothetical protein VIL71_08395 [Spirillospora sp.]